MSTRPPVNKLKEAMQGMASLPSAVPVVPVTPVETVAPRGASSARPPSRTGKRVVSAYVDPAAAKQLRLLSAERDTSTQALLEEALNDLFRKYNRSAVA
jgi:1-acyl-sn-glycerol-3-phosphate acyltransferase